MKPQRPNALHGRVAAVHKCRRSLRRPLFFFRLQISRATLGIIHHREGRIHCIVESSAQGVTTSPKTAGWETPDVMRQDAYTIHHTPKQKRPQEKEKNIYVHIDARYQRCSDHLQKETFRRTRHATRDAPVSNSREPHRAHRTTSGRYPHVL